MKFKKRKYKHQSQGRVRFEKKAKIEVNEKSLEQIKDAYEFVERRQITVKSADDLPQLGGIYAAQMLATSKRSDPNPLDCFEEAEDDDDSKRLLKLPSDGSIFIDGIPFHHFTLSTLQPKHIKRLKENGIEIKMGKFSASEDDQIRENWKSYAAAHSLAEDEAASFMGAAVATETVEDRRDRIRFIHQTLFRPWMCAKLLNRNAKQVFRRCYHLYRVSSLDAHDLREWSAEDDKALLELVKIHGDSWELIGNELMHPRYSCQKRYRKLIGPIDGDEWSNVEISRLYIYLADRCPRNPVIIATVPKYQHLDSHINWACPEFRLLKRTPAERKNKWEELKAQFRAVKERIQAETVKEILREVTPEDPRILSRASTTIKKKVLMPNLMSEGIAVLMEFCIENEIERLRDVNIEELKEKFKAKEMQDYPIDRFLKRAKYMIFVGHQIGLFKMLPIYKDTLPVHLELFQFIYQNVKYARVKKKVLRRYTRRFVRTKGWESMNRDKLIFVEKRHETTERCDESIGRLVNLIQKKIP